MKEKEMFQIYKLGDYEVRVMKPHLFHLTSTGPGGKVISITDFYHPHEVNLVHDLPAKEKAAVQPLIGFLARKLAFRGITDLADTNAFLLNGKKSLLLFDLKVGV